MNKLLEELDTLCTDRLLHYSFTWQRINDYSVEIYRGYRTNYKKVVFTDGHTKPKKALKSAIKELKKHLNETQNKQAKQGV